MRRTVSLFMATALILGTTIVLVLVVQATAGLSAQKIPFLEQESPQEGAVRLFFDPALGFAAPGTTLRLMVEAPSDELTSLYLLLEFDPTKLNLSEEIGIAAPFGAGPRMTSKDAANASGKMEITLILPPDYFGGGPMGVYELATFDFQAVTAELDVPIRFPAVDALMEVVDVETFDVVADFEPAHLVLNPATCGSPAGDHCADLGAPDDEAYHNLAGWSGMQENSPIVPPTGDTTKRFQLLHADNSLTLSVPRAGARYLLLTEVEDGGCDDSFEIYINNQGPVYSYQADPELSDAGVMHVILIPGALVPTTEVLVTYQNTASDDCGYAAVFNSKMIPFDTHFAFLPIATRD